ncbi:hypothetical protein diail_2865 [Diaporthe ilicicola]|nr:hypothetical protein diail_2865 [Diaporthe ilicicola]
MAQVSQLSRLEALPNEILKEILSQMSLGEHCKAIRASPKLLQVFSACRERILLKVIQLTLAPEIFTELLGFLHLPNYANLHHVPEADNDQWPFAYEPMSDFRWNRSRKREQYRLTQAFRKAHLARIDQARANGTSLFPNASLRGPIGPDKLEFKPAFKHVIKEIYDTMRKRVRDNFGEAAAPSTPGSQLTRIHNPAERHIIQLIANRLQRSVLRELLEKRMLDNIEWRGSDRF